MSEIFDIDEGTLNLNLHPGQTRAWRSDKRFVFVVAGTQGGKTSFGPWWLWREIKENGAGDYLAVTATYDLFKLKMLPEMKKVFIDILPGWEYAKSARLIKKGDIRIILRNADAGGGLESATVKAAWLDECGQDKFKLGAWEAIQRRLSLAQGRALGTTTPYNLGWIKTQVYDKWKSGNINYDVVQFESIENPVFPIEEFERARQELPKWKFEMFYRGRFGTPAGLIYNCFDSSKNTCRPFAIPDVWPRFVGVDFGAVNQATIWIAKKPNEHKYYAYRETLEGNITTKEHADKWKAHKEMVTRWRGGSPSEKQQRKDFQSLGVPIRKPRIADVEAGIDRIYALIKNEQLVIFDTLKGTIDELGTYSRVLDGNDEPTEKIQDKNSYHRSDALRYIGSEFILNTGKMKSTDVDFYGKQQTYTEAPDTRSVDEIEEMLR